MQKINIGLIGFGVIGQGVFRILSENKAVIKSRVGKEIIVKSIVDLDPSLAKKVDIGMASFSKNAQDILNDPEIDIVVEAIGGEKPAFNFICQALKNKKYVVTSNKEVISKHKKTFFDLANENNVDIFFEASVGGGIPIIRSFKVGYAANQIQSIDGILNGTTNYILTKIQEDHKNFSDVLKEAQSLGFAEADPTMDVTGLDAAYKLVILAAVAFKVDIQLKDVHFEGIENLTLNDMIYANELGYTIKLIASARLTEDGSMSFKVRPTMVPESHPLASVRNEFNAIFSVGNAMGESMIYGKGAGSFPTGSAVVSDILDIAFDFRANQTQKSRRNLEYEFHKVKLRSSWEMPSKYYLRMLVKDTFGVLEKIGAIFGKNRVSVLKLIQKEVIESNAEIVIITHITQQKAIQKSVSELKKLKDIKEIFSLIQVGLDEINPKGFLGV